MIPRLKGAIAHDHDTKILGEEGEDAVIARGPDLVQRKNLLEKVPETL